MTPDKALAILRDENPKAHESLLRIVAGLFVEYTVADANIAQFGPVVTHPKTGAPVVNPYSSVRERASKALLEHRRLEVGALWEAWDRERAAG